MRYITLAIAFLICTAADAQIIRAEPFYVSPEQPVTTLLLDAYPGAAVAYSLRKLDKDYTGSAIRVRRSNDNAEQDIGFVNNYLDTASMKTFVGANNGFVVTWYNQADSAGVFGIKNSSQSTAINQPIIISSGAIIYDESEVAVSFDGSNDFFEVANSRASMKFLHADKSTTFAAARFASNSNPTLSYAIFSTSTASAQNGATLRYNDEGARNNALTWQVFRSVLSSPAVTVNSDNRITPSVVSLIYQYSDPANATAANRHYAAIDNGSEFNENSLTNAVNTGNATNNFTVGIAFESPSYYYALNGTIQELIIYNSDKSANKTDIRNNINSFYSIY